MIKDTGIFGNVFIYNCKSRTANGIRYFKVFAYGFDKGSFASSHFAMKGKNPFIFMKFYQPGGYRLKFIG